MTGKIKEYWTHFHGVTGDYCIPFEPDCEYLIHVIPPPMTREEERRVRGIKISWSMGTFNLNEERVINPHNSDNYREYEGK